MRKTKRERLEKAGWRVGSADEFLGLSAEESAFLDLKMALSESLREQREARKMTQVALAKRLKSSQSRVAKMEAGDPTVSMDLLVRSLLVVGARPRTIARAMTRRRGKVAG